MRRFILAAVTVLVAASGFTGITLVSAMGASAQSSCTGDTPFVDNAGYGVFIPTIGNNTGRDDCVLGVGNDSIAVYQLQVALDGCYNAGLDSDGIFGSLTKAALVHAQKVEHITADGVYGPQTRDHLKWWDIGGSCSRL